MITGIVIPADHTVPVRVEQLDPVDGDYNRIVGGDLEVVGFARPAASLYLNEEGKLNGLPLNPRATAMTWVHNSALRGRDLIVGDVLLVGPVDEYGDDLPVPQEYLRLLFAATRFRVEVQRVGACWFPIPHQMGDVDAAYVAAAELARTEATVEEIRVVEELATAGC
jgi:hypothetical protein